MDYALKDHTWDFLYLIFMVIDLYIVVNLLVRKRSDFRKQLGWLIVMIFNPIVGFGAYIMVGKPMFIRSFARHKNEGMEIIDRKISESPVCRKSLSVARALSASGALAYSEDSSVSYIGRGSQYFDELYTDLRKAQTSICIECYIIRRDETSREFMDILSERARAGVDVRVIFDDYGYDGKDMRYIKGMKDAGCRCVFFHNMNRLLFSPLKNCRNHRKTVVIDGRIAYQGGFNIGDEYMGEGPLGEWRDAAVRIVGPQAQQLGRMFAEDWEYTTKEDISGLPALFPRVEPAGDTPMQVVPGDPVVQDLNPLMCQFLAMIECSGDSLYIETPYFVPPRPIFEALAMRARSGTDVRIIIPDEADHPCVYWSNRHYASIMMEAGAKVYEYHGGFIHTKMIIGDGQYCSVGSANFDERSIHINLECNVLMYSEKMGEKLTEEFMRDLGNSTEYTMEMYDSRTRSQRFKTFLSLITYDQL